MIKLLMRMKIYFSPFSYRPSNSRFLVFRMNLFAAYMRLKSIFRRFKLIIKIIDKSGVSHLTVDLRDICSNLHTKEDTPNGTIDLEAQYRELHKNYKWDKLEKHIVKYGLVEPIEVYMCNNIDPIKNQTCKYCIVNGNHRIIILKNLYPSNHKVKIIVNHELTSLHTKKFINVLEN